MCRVTIKDLELLFGRIGLCVSVQQAGHVTSPIQCLPDCCAVCVPKLRALSTDFWSINHIHVIQSCAQRWMATASMTPAIGRGATADGKFAHTRTAQHTHARTQALAHAAVTFAARACDK